MGNKKSRENPSGVAGNAEDPTKNLKKPALHKDPMTKNYEKLEVALHSCLKLSNNKRFDGKFQLIAGQDNEKFLVPLKKVSISCELRGPTAATNVELTYMNTDEVNPMECEYIFPIDKSTILANFEASIDGKTIMTNVKEKERA